MSNKKLVQISSVHLVNDTRIFYKICKSLVKAEFSVDLIIQHPKNEIKDGVNIIALPFAKRKFDRISKIFPILFFKSIKYPKESIFHFHDPELIPLGLLLKLKGYKVIYDVHEDVPKSLLTREWIPKELRKGSSRLIELIEKHSAKRFNGIVTVLDSIEHRFNRYSENVVQIRNYPIIKEERIKNSIGRFGTKKYIIYIGDLTTIRGIPKLVDAIDLVKDKEVELWLGGNFSENGLFEKLKEKKGWSRTKYLGWVKQEEINTILNEAVCGLLTLEILPAHDESLNVKMFEYMRAGIPIISTELKIPKQIIEENKCGIILHEHNPKEIAKAVDYLLENENEAKCMGKNGKKGVLSNYTWGTEEKKLVNFYKSIFEKNEQ